MSPRRKKSPQKGAFLFTRDDLGVLAGGHRFTLPFCRFPFGPETGQRCVVLCLDDVLVHQRVRVIFNRVEHAIVEDGEHVVLDALRFLDGIVRVVKQAG